MIVCNRRTPAAVLNDMKFFTALLALSVAAALQGAPVVASPSSTAPQSADVVVFVGEYNWRYQDRPGPLRAEFTPTGPAEWDVAFHFKFDGSPHTYKGTAGGSLTEGALEGRVFSENRRRKFTFQGEVEDLVLEADHAEATSGRARRTGTLALKREAAAD